MTEEIRNFIMRHERDDIPSLLLKYKTILDYPATFVANQINGRRSAKEKLPTWYENTGIVYPPQASLEQCSSEATAKFKCDVINRANGEGNRRVAQTIADLTGGFGVDSFFFSQIFKRVYHVEPNQELLQLAKESHEQLGVKNIIHVQSTAEQFLAQTNQKLDWVYLDPSRKSNGKKVFRLTESHPNVVKLLTEIFFRTENILVKTSPLLDLKEGIRQLSQTKSIHVVSVGNECKEILIHLTMTHTDDPDIYCVNLTDKIQVPFWFRFLEEAETESTFSEPLDFIYEPNSSILKAGAFKKIGKAYGLSKISVNTHFYTSSKCQPDFPGRIFKVISPFVPTERAVQARPYFNIVSRNHPLRADEIKKKFKLMDGGENYLLAFSGRQKKYMLVAERISSE
jgi:16S rRNA G966 N2-methylase RsmD